LLPQRDWISLRNTSREIRKAVHENAAVIRLESRTELPEMFAIILAPFQRLEVLQIAGSCVTDREIATLCSKLVDSSRPKPARRPTDDDDLGLEAQGMRSDRYLCRLY
jgi:hypothetical protein